MTPVLDHRTRHDERSRAYGIAPIVGEHAGFRAYTFWVPGPVLDQGEEGACVGHGWTNEATAEPVPVNFARAGLHPVWPRDPQAFAFAFYDWCRKHDEYPGDDTEGTSVLAGAKGMKLLGLVPEYRWAFGVEQVIDALVMAGPVVLGITWLDGMYDAPGGWLRVAGTEVGGHCILAIGYNPAHAFPDGTVDEAIAVFNSWGPDWGTKGVAWIRKSELAYVLKGGEACVPMRRAYGPETPATPEPTVEPAPAPRSVCARPGLLARIACWIKRAFGGRP